MSHKIFRLTCGNHFFNILFQDLDQTLPVLLECHVLDNRRKLVMISDENNTLEA